MDARKFDIVVSMCMDYETQNIFLNHTIYGLGRVVAIRYDLMAVEFNNKVVKEFKFPDAIGTYLFPIERGGQTNNTGHNAVTQSHQVDAISQDLQEKRRMVLQRRKERKVRGDDTVIYKATVEQREEERIAEAKQKIHETNQRNNVVQEASQQSSITDKVQYKHCPKCGLNLILIDEDLCSVCKPYTVRALNYATYKPPHYEQSPKTVGYSSDDEDWDYEYDQYFDDVMAETSDYADSMARSDDSGWYYADDEKD